MRPVQKGASSIEGEFNDYEEAKPELVSRLGLYCSYCERRIATNLAVEHIEPKKGPHGKPELEKSWHNFLLACVNCNSTKGDKAVNFEQLLFPDRDNTFFAYHYQDDGTIKINRNLSDEQKTCAANTLTLLGLDKPMQVYQDANGEFVALDRVRQRMELIATAQISLGYYLSQPDNEPLQQSITQTALASGHFSLWMKVFDQHPTMKLKFIRAFAGTEQSGCFNMDTGETIAPAPNHDE